MKNTFFKTAKIIFADKSKKPASVSRQLAFRKDFTLEELPKSLTLSITGRTFYKIYLNGDFIFYGPARAAHGYSRVDIMDILPSAKCGINSLAIELTVYSLTSLLLYVTGEYGFIQAEVTADDEIVAATDSSWRCAALPQRDMYVERFSHARGPSEVYNLDEGYYSWRTDSLPRSKKAVELEDPELCYQPRGLSLPDLSICNDPTYTGSHKISPKNDSDAIQEYPLMVFSPSPNQNTNVMVRPVLECLNDKLSPFAGAVHPTGDSAYSITAKSSSWALDFDFDTTYCGFIGLDFVSPTPVTIDLIAVNKLNEEGEFEPRTCHANTVVRLSAPKGQWRFEAFEVMDIRYLRIVVRGSRKLTINEIFLRNYRAQTTFAGSFSCSDNDLNRIYQAARLNLRLNSIDGFLDCPGRERGNWATDSFWTAQAARLFFGDASIERVHLENFLAPTLRKHFKKYLPACYPGDHDCCIHNWSIFIGLELYEYFQRTNDREFIRECTEGVDFLIFTLKQYANNFGVLENLPDIVYVDGSTACKKDYNYPISTGTNVMYADMLKKMGMLYQREDWLADAAKIEAVLKKVFAIDDAGEMTHYIRDSFSMDASGKIVTNDIYSEGSQYICMWLGDIKQEKLPNYFRSIFDNFGCDPKRKLNGEQWRIMRSELLVGMMVRFELLQRHGEFAQLQRELKKLYLPMIDQGPGTLWEGWSRHSNLTHGYQSYAGGIIVQAFLGLNIPNAVTKTICITPHPLGLRWAKGVTKVENDNAVSVEWHLNHDSFTMMVEVPEGYTAKVTLPHEIFGWQLQLNRHKLAYYTREFSVKHSFVLKALKKL